MKTRSKNPQSFIQKAGLRYSFFILAILFITSAWTLFETTKPVIYIIGDSTVKNGRGNGDGGLWGWGNFIPQFFDTTKITIENDAIGGRSSRTFITEGRWDAVLAKLKPGDFLLIQFGHNDGGPLADTSRARGTIRGIGDESKEIYNPIRKKQEVVYTYGYYMRKYITDAKSKGVTPIVCSPIPRNIWKDGKIARDSASYTTWSSQVAEKGKCLFINLNEIICNQYDKLGEEKVKTTMFTTKDHTHTTREGAILNAASVVEGVKNIKECPLNKYLLTSK